MDTSDPDITFDDDGICNHCHHYVHAAQKRLGVTAVLPDRLAALVREIKQRGRGKDYDCIIGVSGGVDSTYVAYLVKQLGLRPLAVHFDNGWNSELAVGNIERTLKKLGIDLYTYVVDWQEFKDLQLAFLRASTPDSEVPTDHAILALLHRVAAMHNVRYIIPGTNCVTEAILPLKWGYGYFDLKYIKAVQARFGKRRLTTYPQLGLVRLAWYRLVRRIQLVSVLDYVHYDKEKAMQLIQEELGWVYYGGKHYESIYTRFFQASILPEKFNIDKRRAHYSNLICSGQMTREQALTLMKEPPCREQMRKEDLEYVIKKFEISEEEYKEIMTAPSKLFLDYPNQFNIVKRIKKVLMILKGGAKA